MRATRPIRRTVSLLRRDTHLRTRRHSGLEQRPKVCREPSRSLAPPPTSPPAVRKPLSISNPIRGSRAHHFLSLSSLALPDMVERFVLTYSIVRLRILSPRMGL